MSFTDAVQHEVRNSYPTSLGTSAVVQRRWAAMGVGNAALLYSGRTVHELLSSPCGGIRYHSRGELAQIQLTSHGTSRYPATTHVSVSLLDTDRGLGVTWRFLRAATACSCCVPVGKSCSSTRPFFDGLFFPIMSIK